MYLLLQYDMLRSPLLPGPCDRICCGASCVIATQGWTYSYTLTHCKKNVSWYIYWYPKNSQLVLQHSNQFGRIIHCHELWSKAWYFDSVLTLAVPYNWCRIAEYEDPSHGSPCCLVSHVIFIHKALSWYWFPSGIWHIDGYWILSILVEVLPIKLFESILWYWRLGRIKV